MKKWKKEHNSGCTTMLQNMVNNPMTYSKTHKEEYGGWLGAMASMIGHLAAATGNKAFVFQSMAEGMEEFDSLSSQKFCEKNSKKVLTRASGSDIIVSESERRHTMTSKDFGETKTITIQTNGHDFIVTSNGYTSVFSVDDYKGWGSEITIGVADGGEACYIGVENA